ncbi:hypothetical protein HF1_04540 [Mycoplasma haemofelis str. Langford 1]|uniref:Uncharacterized protein n=1 Tax=Mycoplasma haemofelis (strain Langford 1) TaxID=941640 RepID=E8ZH41_MYCHL|nr:hypothetical protein [Mycoplasma haemofelis]CBY92462.1 hypothetical protein HF1_04540 [Mycoplasma haemofelis str. Langford 1]
MNSLVLKGVLGFSASTAVAAGATKLAVGSGNVEPKSISKLMGDHYPEKRLLFKGYQGVFNGSQPEWKFVWKKYFNAYVGSPNNPFSVQLTSADGNAPDAFMKACKDIFGVKVSSVENEKFVWALEYCTRQTSVGDLIYGTEKRPVPTSGNQGDVSSKWTELWNTYRADNQGKSNGQDEWGLFVSSTNETNVPQEFKDRCAKEIQVKTGDLKHRSFVNALKYCSK